MPDNQPSQPRKIKPVQEWTPEDYEEALTANREDLQDLHTYDTSARSIRDLSTSDGSADSRTETESADD